MFASSPFRCCVSAYKFAHWTRISFTFPSGRREGSSGTSALPDAGRAMPLAAVPALAAGPESLPRLLARGPYDAADEFERQLAGCAGRLQAGLDQGEARVHTWLQERVEEGDKQHADVVNGLLYGILTADTQAASRLMGYMTSVTRDGYAACLVALQRLAMEKWCKLLDGPRVQLLWMLRQLVPLAVADLDQLCLALLRQVAGGDLSPGNVWLASQLLDLLAAQRLWLYGSVALLTAALCTFLRLLPDHAGARTPPLTELRQSEAAFCCQVLRERFQDCLVIGRDLVRLLQDVAALPEFESIWRDLLGNPAAFQTPSFSDLGQLYVTRTPARYLTSRVTPDMESQLRFMLTHVRMGNQRRYQAWFAARFLASPESESLVGDLVRFVCCSVHPPNHVLQSDVVPRWAVLGWLLKCCKSSHVEASAKLALFYDWLFFVTKTDNIMNIEPAILLMVHSIPKYVDMTNSLLDFLFLLMENYDPQRKLLIQRGISSSLDILVGKGVVRSLEPLASSPLVAQVLRNKLHTYFPSHCKPPELQLSHSISSPQPDSVRAIAMLPGGPTTSADGGTGSQVPGPRVVQGSESVPSGGSKEVFQAAAVGGPVRVKDGLAASQVPGREEREGVDGGAKRKRSVAATEEAHANLHILLQRLEAAQGTVGEGRGRGGGEGEALEHFLLAYIAAWDSLAEEGGGGGKRARAPGENHPNGHSVHVLEASVFNPSTVAQKLAEILGKKGYQLFAPLQQMPNREGEADEMGSATSTILRFYVLTRNPQLRRILLTWQAQGRSVSARLLCYVARLAEGVEGEGEGIASGMLDEFALGVQSELESDGVVGEVGASKKRGLGVESDIIARVECGGLGAGSEVEEKGKADGRHESHSRGEFLQEKVVSSKKGLHKGVEDLQAAVKKAFQAFEDFLQDSGSEQPSSLPTEGTSSGRGESLDSAPIPKIKLEEAAAGIGQRASLLQSALSTCLLWNAYRLLQVLPSVFRYLPHLSTGREAVVSLLVSVTDPIELAAMESCVELREYKVIGSQKATIENLLQASASWQAQEQQALWRLMAAESQSWSGPTLIALVGQVSRGCVTAVWPEALSGILSLLRQRKPSADLLSAVLSMSSACGKFPAAILSAWSASHSDLLRSLIEQKQSETEEGEDQGVGQWGHGGAGQSSCGNRTMGLLLAVLKKDHGLGKDEVVTDNAKELVTVLTRHLTSHGGGVKKEHLEERGSHEEIHVGRTTDNKYLSRRHEGKESSVVGRPVGNSSNV